MFFSIRRVKVSMEGSKVKNDIRSSDIADESPAASPAGVPQVLPMNLVWADSKFYKLHSIWLSIICHF